MPIDDYLPVLDDRTYDSIFTELRTRIPRYTPEWTDFNDSDPGITMLQVFSFLAESLAYRMNKVPTLLYLKFLQLLGVELTPAQPAQVQITFGVQAAAPSPTVVLPKGTQVIAQTPGGGPPLVFEAAQGLTCLRPTVQAVLAYDGYAYSDVTAPDAAASGYQPFGPTADPGSALLLGFDASQPFPGAEITFYVWASAATQAPAPVTCGAASAVYPSATLSWHYWDGYSWSPVALLKDETVALTRSGQIVIKTPDNALATLGIAPTTTPLYWLRLSVDASQYETPPSIAAIRPNTMTLTQMQTVVAEVLGGSDGSRDQVFTLNQTPVLDGSLTLTIDQGSGAETWTGVSDFYSSGPNDLHYVLNRTTGEVRFGDGVHGAIPIANPSNPSANVVAAEYRYGGGSYGNVGAGTLTTLRSPVDGIDGKAVTNVMASYGGTDEESIDDAKERAPSAIRARCRAVTNDDFELFARQAAAIARAKAYPLRHPDFPGVKVPGCVTVIVVPESDSPKPVPSAGTLRTVCAYLDQRRLLTTEVYVAAPAYQQARVTVSVIAADTADLAQVQRDVDAALLAYLHPLTGGDAGTGWPFGGTIAFSRVFYEVFAVAGVASVGNLVITLDGVDAPACRDVPIADGALVYSTQHQVSVSYATSGANT
jgi:predicted phage baseplate assembly protein